MFNYYSKSYLVLLLLFPSVSFSIMPIPSTPQNSRGGDAVRGRDVTTCTQGTHVGPSLDFGVVATQNNTTSNSSDNPVIVNNYTGSSSATSVGGGDMGVYARIVVPLGEEPNRIDCTKLYELEIERLTIELENLKKAGSSAVTVE